MKKFVSFIVSHLRVIYLVVLMLVSTALILLMFPSAYTRVEYDYQVGSFWKGDDLYAPFDFAVVKSQQESQKEENAIKELSIMYFNMDTTALSRSRQNLQHAGLDRRQTHIAQQVIDLLSHSVGYYNTDEPAEGQPVVLLNGNVGQQCTAESMMSPSDVTSFVRQCIADSVQADRLATLLIDSVLEPSLVFDANRTHLELETRLSQANITSYLVQQDELIIAKGGHIDEETAHVIETLEAEETARRTGTYNPVVHYTGQALLCIVAFVALYIFLKNIRHPLLENNKKVTFCFTLMLLIAAVVALLVRVRVDWVLLAPVCVIPILIRIFFDMRVALYIHIVVVIILAIMVPNSYEFIYYQLIAGMMSIITVRHLEKRSNFFTVALVVFLTYSLIYFAGTLSQDTFSSLQPSRFLIFFFNATLTLLAYPLIFIFEHLFGMTTNLTLMEIGSTNTPALREMSQKAPGTFQHSMQVANISEDLISEIGGNAVLARVGALYHDIGKTMAPLYFTENQNTGFNPHDNLDSEESAHIIIQHVRDGIDLAKKYHLPPEVTDFIRTHHGTTVTGYFYALAKQQHPNEEISMDSYRYQGPPPFSRETAVVMLVDSVEAACRSLKNHDPESIDKMVDRIIDDKINLNQLSNCPLTMQDITLIRSRLKSKMHSIYHVRIEYPVVK
ncbi:MAG: HDIG domain-containing protein [Bacteroidales bacterium]|nr:HDIG domain-containing protein [Bacteroidales bacterium]